MNFRGRNFFPPQSMHDLSPPCSSALSTLPLNATLNSRLRELAYARMHPIEGRSKMRFQISRPSGSSSSGNSRPNGIPIANGANGNGHIVDTKSGDFIYYSDSDGDEDFNTGDDEGSDRISFNFVDCLKSRELGMTSVGGGRFYCQRLSSDYGTRHMLTNAILKETCVSVPNMNKIFCSKWLSDKRIVFGTKCNKLMVFDVNNHRMDQIPGLRSSGEDSPLFAESDFGIHAIEMNPSRTLLATCAKNSKDIAVYRLPTLDPVCVGQGAHNDWIFDMTWIDDQFLVSGSRDSSIALWRITDDMITEVESADTPSYLYTNPLVTKPCKNADRVRAICFNQRRSEIVVLSLNAYIHCWNGLAFQQRMSKKLPHAHENVCLSVDEDSLIYAVGSKANTDLLDARTLQVIRKIPSKNNGCGIRSVSFRGNILTIGTGIGLVMFWDLRASKYLESTMNSNRAVTLKASGGWVNDCYDQNLVEQQKDLRAIYTHCYDSSGTRLFAAGGPLHFNSKGNYIGLFQ